MDGRNERGREGGNEDGYLRRGVEMVWGHHGCGRHASTDLSRGQHVPLLDDMMLLFFTVSDTCSPLLQFGGTFKSSTEKIL
ncbi:hypothetical protein HPP92_011935 [Vanilla planifolia]|uniref:Uncharacterized protein n=1 Tax=Vanilla planifolia TaxID=51239 RepID=A0A835V5I0_VANPL|nr:hypothetical protein HPP92_011935 [Vanilla planifolia]